MKKLLIVLMLLLSTKAFCQEFEWPEDHKYWVGYDTTTVLSEFDFKLDSTQLSIIYSISDSLIVYFPYNNDTLKIILMVSDDMSDYTEEELSWYSPGVYIERGYIVKTSYETLFLDNKKREYKNTIIWDWRYYDWN